MPSEAQQGELLVDYVSPKGRTVSAARGTLIVGALQALREHGHLDALLAELSPPVRSAVTDASAMSWVPIEPMTELCFGADRLRLTDSQLMQLGGVAAGSLASTVLSVVLRTIGATPWTLVSNLDRLWDRFYQGGAVSVVRLGPTDALVAMHGLPHGATRYCRTTTQAFFQGLLSHVAKRVQAAPARSTAPSPTSFAFAMSWE